MSTIQELDAKVAELEQQLAEAKKAAEAQRVQERTAIIAQINALVAENGVAVNELAFPRAAKGTKASSPKPQKSTPGKAKYQNPETGATWTGHGKPPAWIKDAPNRDAFLIVDK